MSAQKTYSIRCPQCNHTQNVELYDSINVAQQPELKEALFQNRLNRVVCEDCSASFRIDKPLLYHDADRNILIHWMPDNAMSRDEILDQIWGMDAFPNNRTIDNYIVKLRQKLESTPKDPQHLQSIYGKGYRLIFD